MKGTAAIPPIGKATSKKLLTRPAFKGESSMYVYCDRIVAIKKFILAI
jgi:hypothetical protein